MALASASVPKDGRRERHRDEACECPDDHFAHCFLPLGWQIHPVASVSLCLAMGQQFSTMAFVPRATSRMSAHLGRITLRMRLVVVAGHSGFVSYFSAPRFSLQTLRHLHTCSGYFRLDRLPDDFHVIADPADIRALAELGISEHDRSSLTTDRMPASVSGINATPSLAHQT
jgi:hypothetical protein